MVGLQRGVKVKFVYHDCRSIWIINVPDVQPSVNLITVNSRSHMAPRINRYNFSRIKPSSKRTDCKRRFSHFKVGAMVRGQVTNSYSQSSIYTIWTAIGTDGIAVQTKPLAWEKWFAHRITLTNLHTVAWCCQGDGTLQPDRVFGHLKHPNLVPRGWYHVVQGKL